MKLKAGFTIEAAVVLSVILLSLATAIMWCYKKRDIAFKNYTLQAAAVDAAYTEEKWAPGISSLKNVEQNSDMHLHVIGSLSGDVTTASRDELIKRAYANAGDSRFDAKIVDIESFMRLAKVVGDFNDSRGKEN